MVAIDLNYIVACFGFPVATVVAALLTGYIGWTDKRAENLAFTGSARF